MLLPRILSAVTTPLAGLFLSALALEPEDDVDFNEDHSEYDDAERIRKWDRNDS